MCIYCERCFIFLCMNGQLCQIHLLNTILFTSNELQGLIISALGENLACIVHAESTCFVTIVYPARYPGGRAGGSLSPACFVLCSDVPNGHLYLLFYQFFALCA